MSKNIILGYVDTYRSGCEEHARESGGTVTLEDQVLHGGGDDTVSEDGLKSRLHDVIDSFEDRETTILGEGRWGDRLPSTYY